MRIVHVVRQFYPAIGGFESVVWELATRQAGDGHTVRVITLDRLFKTDKAAKLAARGRQFRTRSDTETILHAYAEHGPACVEQTHS